MQRDLTRLRTDTFDLLVIGGGMQGAALALEASARGLAVALLERDDFASGASSNNLKILHGGLRHLQRLDVLGARRASAARRALVRLAPHFVNPVPCSAAVRGWGGKAAIWFGAALLLSDLACWDRNAEVPRNKRLPNGRMLSYAEFTDIARALSGDRGLLGALWWDMLAENIEGLVMEMIGHAVHHEACVANYVEAHELLVSNGSTVGVAAIDRETNTTFEVRARHTIWAGGKGGREFAKAPLPEWRWCKGLNLVLKSDIEQPTALTLSLSRAVPGTRGHHLMHELLFVPWRKRLMVGTHCVFPVRQSDEPTLRRRSVSELLESIDRAAPHVHPGERDIEMVHWGDVPLDARWRLGQPLRLATGVLFAEGARAGLAGFWMVSSPKLATTLEVARHALARIYPDFKRMPVRQAEPYALGCARSFHADPIESRHDECEAAGYTAAREALALRLDDAVFRRTGLGSAGYPGRHRLEACARGMARALGWSDERIATEVDTVVQQYCERHFLSTPELRETQEETK
jgi:glycerol-3-phosphate dehydrogenase